MAAHAFVTSPVIQLTITVSPDHTLVSLSSNHGF